jgi:hypothetical protein
MSFVLTPGELRALLEDLCVRLGFCLPPDARSRIEANPPADADHCAMTVFTAEGLDPSSPENRSLVDQVRGTIAMAFIRAECRVAAARYALGDLPSWDLVEIANVILGRGVYSDALGKLGTDRDLMMSAAGPLFEQALQDLNVEIPSSTQAIWVLLGHHIRQLASRAVAGREGLGPIMDIYYLAELHARSTQFVGDSHGIQHLVGAFYEYDDIDVRQHEVSFRGHHGAAVKALDDTVVRLAHEWLATYDLT